MRKKTKKILAYLILLISIILVISSLFKIERRNKDLARNKKIDMKTKENIEVSHEKNNSQKYNIDWQNLEKLNSDTVAYLKVNNTNIDYVVVKGKDNKFYLSHNFNKEYSIAGWIFGDYRNRFDGQDKNIIIYGHSMNDGTMFGTLKNVLNESWYDNPTNLTIKLFTKEGVKEYEVFSLYKIIREDYYIQTEFKSDSEYMKFLTNLQNRSIKNFGINLKKSDNILTLSTCYAGGIKRVVLHAKLKNSP